VSQAVGPVLDRFVDPDADGVALVAREKGQMVIEEHDRADIAQHFQWYRRGIGL
jgi:hypothetical protein